MAMITRVNQDELAVKAPNRIDFAGGTLDLYPLFLLEEDALTINAAISIYSHAWVRKRRDRKILLCSKDQKIRNVFSDLSKLPKKGPLHLLAEAVRFFHPPFGLEVTALNEAPKGSGLGASSALLVALMNAMARLTGKPLNKMLLMHDASLVEAKILGIPTGKQDYAAALFGGFRAYHWQPSGCRMEPLRPSSAFRRKLRLHSLLVFSGESHMSARSNWEVLRRYMENEKKTRKAIRQIKALAHQMLSAFKKEDLSQIAECLNREWFYRIKLAKEVSTPKMASLERELSRKGLMGMKACGAGGGGCLFVLVEPSRREEAEEIIQRQKCQLLPFEFVER